MIEKAEPLQALEVWGGVECTVHRTGNEYGNQLFRNGHYQRSTDLELIASLGIRTIRYPVLWEMIAPKGLKEADWSWVDERLYKMKELKLTPIVGLLHHGSGPPYTSLLDPNFAEKFTDFAVAVAQRYPWLEYFTPINEPLTTARFSCLYGHWYPHARHMYAFATSLLNQCKATVMAMRALKQIIPEAKLVQTEDLGKCYGTEKLRYQWENENERRWLSLDILCGKISDNKFAEGFFKSLPKYNQHVDFFVENFVSPDIIGINHYITSERYLDHEYSKYPCWAHGSNGIDKYADVEIVRADIHKRLGHYGLLKETHERYGLPLALTEVHMGAVRDEQMRWFMEAWKASQNLREEGVDVRAVTAWSMFGAYDWNSLLTRQNDFYEPGIFDVSSGMPRPTALCDLIRQLTKHQTFQHPVLEADGWWKNPGAVNFIFGTKQEGRQLATVKDMSVSLPSPTPKPILITGATGTLGQAFSKICKIRNISHVLLSRKELDIADRDAVNATLKKYEPWAVVNAAGYVKVDEAETNTALCFRENVQGPAVLAAACRNLECRFLTFSSDLVFNGTTQTPYKESDVALPLNIYGVSKYLAEDRVLNAYPSSLVIRTSAFFGPWDEFNFLSQMISSIQNGETFSAPSDFIVSPTYVPDLVNTCLDLIIDREHGIWHVSNPSAVSWLDFALMTAEIAKLKTSMIRQVNTNSLGYKAMRPAYSALTSERGVLLQGLDNAVHRFITDRGKKFDL